jgi:hypothetical protein|tara:strand:- start:8398 stop:10662 length:2265 start_codon:yes stop_codon:yes gene_type:complete
MWGQYRIDPNNLDANLFQSIYQVMVLFLGSGEWTFLDAPPPWQVEIARIAAPIVTVLSVIFVFAKDVRVEIINYFVRYGKDHLIIAGLGDKSWQFIQSCHKDYKVVVVEVNSKNLFIDRARSLGVSVIISDILASGAFARINLADARHLVTLTGNDGVNLELALKARDQVRKTHPGKHHLRIHLHVDDTRISMRLENYPKFFSDYSLAEISFFSVYDLSARELFREYPPDIFAEVFGQKTIHIAIYHFGRMAEHILVEMTRMCQFANAARLRITVFDKDASDKEAQLHNEYPTLREVCDIEFIDREVKTPQVVHDLPQELLESVTQHVICCPTDEESLDLSLILRSVLLQREACNTPIMVRMQESSGLAQLLESNIGSPEVPDGLYPFGMLDQVLNVDYVINDRQDRTARALHQDYLARRGREVSADPRLYSALQEWEEVPEPARKSSRLEADHLQVKLRAIRCTFDMERDHGFEFTALEAEMLAKMEHDRWMSNKVLDQWRAGPERIEGARINPLAVEWEDLPLPERQTEITGIKSLPALLGKEGSHIQRELVIGVTGHRLHKLDADSPYVISSIKSTLADIQATHENHKLIILSPLAEGADRLVARIAMDEFGMFLRVPLPLPYELYQTDFKSNASLEEFKELVGKAERYFELPMKFGTQEQLASRMDGTPNELRNKQYALAGAYIVERSDEMIAVYDQLPAAGTGGTGQIVNWRREHAVDAEFSNESDLILRPDMKAVRIIAPSADATAGL